MGIEIKRAKPEDAQALAALHVASWQAAYQGIVPDDYLAALSVKPRIERFAQNIATNQAIEFYNIYDGPSLAGLMNLHPAMDADMQGALEVGALYLHPDYFGRELGKAAMGFALNRARARCAKAVCLWVLEENTRARRFYEKCGFAPDGAKEEIAIGKSLIKIRYTKELDQC